MLNGAGYKSQKQAYNSLDFFKWIMAIFVVAIHTHPLENCTSQEILTAYSNIVRIAVPFFFITSGFLLFRKMDNDLFSRSNFERIRSYILKISKLYFLWTIIFLPITLYDYIAEDTGILYSTYLFIKGFIFVGEHFYSWPLWYLLSTFYSLIAIYMLMKLRVREIPIFVISVFVFIFGSMISVLIDDINSISGIMYYFVALMSLVFESGRLFTGMGYIASGMIIARYRIVVNKHLSLFGIIPFAFAKIYLPPVLSSVAMLILCIFVFEFVVALTLKDSKYWYYFRKSSTVIYFTHMIFFFIYTLIFRDFRYYGMDAFLISLACTILFSVIVLKYENKYKTLKLLFS